MTGRVAPLTRAAGRKTVRASWSSGRPVDTGPLADQVFKGIFIDVGIDAELDDAADAAAWPRGAMSHQDGAAREHWYVPDPALIYVLIPDVPQAVDPKTGEVGLLQSIGEWAWYDVSGYGIGARWPKGGLSGLSVQVVFRDLLAQNYALPIPFAVTSSNTDDLTAALLTHADLVLAAREQQEKGAKKPARALEFFDLALPITHGPKVVRKSKRGGDASTTVYPLACGHPERSQWTLGYLRTLLPPQGVNMQRCFEAHFDGPNGIVAWARHYREDQQTPEQMAERRAARDAEVA